MMEACIEGSLTQQEIGAKFANKSTLPVAHVLLKIHLMGIHLCVYEYALLRFEQVHRLSLYVG